MKRLVLLIGIVLFALNTLAGFLLSGYPVPSFLLSDFSLVLTTLGMYYIATYPFDPAFRIGLGTLLSITGIVRFFLCMQVASGWCNNPWLLVAVGIWAFEWIVVGVCRYLMTRSNP